MPEIDKKSEKLMALLEVGRELASNMDLDPLLALIIKKTSFVMDADRSSLFLVDKKTNELYSKIAEGAGEIRFPIGKGIAGFVAQSGQIINIPDAYADPRFNPAVDKQTGYRTRTILTVPLKTTLGEIVGVIQALNKKGEDKGAFTQFDEEIAMAFAGQAAVAITNAIYHHEVLAKQKMERDLQIAKSVQESFLPQDLPVVKGLDFAAYYDAAQEVGGDFYDFIPLSEDHTGIILGDVSGKGVPAALLMARLMSDLRFVSLIESEPKAILSKVNDMLAKRSQRGMFVTLVFVIVDSLKRRMTFSSAGHLPPMLIKANGKSHMLGLEKGIPLGIAENREFSQDSVSLDDGDTVLLYTDGVMEARNAKGKEFGLKKIAKALKDKIGGSAKEINAHLLSEVQAFAGDTPQHDDLTYVLFKAMPRKEKATDRASKTRHAGFAKSECVSLSVPSDPKYLALVRKNVDGLIAELGFTEGERRKIVIAVDEATSNVMKYGYKGDTTQRIDFVVETTGGNLVFKIRDYGETPDVSKIKPREISDVRPGGLGTHFLREVMDKVDYNTSLGVGTLLTLSKKLPKQESKQ